ncbi:MAG: histidine--tRNA ligase [Lachnospiraceae bacterium]|nr:histidine--tRNA ligase [Lachnospiraceae bacterium]
MSLKKKPVNGMKDILPAEMQIRDYVIGLIKETYRSFGFTPIDTPSVEHIENLSNKQGGENEKLIFKILKRGEKLKLETAKSEDDLVDGGLRYDLTVPLVRYYSNHANELPVPFKALQIGYVWRADRPQRGRYRQFMQCDIDILGDESNMAEIELILATSATLVKLGFKNFQIRINDRRILRAMAAYSGFTENEYDSVFITLDKMDKIGLSGVTEELKNNNFSSEKADKFVKLVGSFSEANTRGNLDLLTDILANDLDSPVIQNMTEILESTENAKSGEYEIIFDPTLVRGMTYYTGTIFEVAIPEFGGSCGGGGRYDKMVGNFTGKDVPGVGFSIGFERIILLLMESGFVIPDQATRKAYLLDKGIDNKITGDILLKAQMERESGVQVLVTRMNKNKKFQKEQLSKEGYNEIVEIWKNG